MTAATRMAISNWAGSLSAGSLSQKSAPIRGYEHRRRIQDGCDGGLAGPEYFDSRPNRRIVTGQWSWLTQAEAHGVYLSILREQDVEKEVYAIFDPDTQFPDQCWFLGRFRTLNAIEWPWLDRHSVGFEISEVL